MKPDHVVRILDGIKSVKIAIYGDYCLDAYWIMNPEGSEISVETGNQAQAIENHYVTLGGVANVLANVAALNPAQIIPVGVIGNDIYGRELTKKISDLGIDTSGFVVQEDYFDTYVFTKKYLHDQEIERVDFGIKNKRSPETDQALLSNIAKALAKCEVLIINQQVPGAITNPQFVEELNDLFKKYDDKIILVDSRHYSNQFEHVIFKSNDLEIEALDIGKNGRAAGLSLAAIQAHATNVANKTQKPVFVTMGPKGILSVSESGVEQALGIQLLKSIETVGAGDTVLSALSLALGAGCSAKEAAEFANLAAGVTVQKLLTTGIATPAEIVQLNEEANYLYQPELAISPRLARYVPSTDIEICYEDVLDSLGHIKHAVFDHDGTISTLREGWEKIMEPVMIQAILGDQLKTVTQTKYENVQQRVREFIDLSTGVQTIVQMQGLVELVNEFNYVSKNKIADKFGYKEIFNTALMERVNERLSKFSQGTFSVNDFIVKGATDFLKAMKARGIKLYLASGTDKQDVINEAEALGYAEVFEGRIYGSVGDISKYSKKMVIDHIIKENKLQGHELAVFGDGPVEIQVCRNYGGIAVGIASDEIRRYGLNFEKRTRLIKSGAHLIVPDFAQGNRLIKLLFKEN